MTKKKKTRMADEAIYLITNDPSEFKQGVLQGLYLAADNNQLGYGDVKDAETGEVFPALLGLTLNETGGIAGVHTVGRLFLGSEELDRTYLLPDGQGGFINPED